MNKTREEKIEDLATKLGAMKGDIVTSKIVLHKIEETLEKLTDEFEPIIDAIRRKN